MLQRKRRNLFRLTWGGSRTETMEGRRVSSVPTLSKRRKGIEEMAEGQEDKKRKELGVGHHFPVPQFTRA
jgi:hypothetical protein